jgi:multidrug resistance efflux pump
MLISAPDSSRFLNHHASTIEAAQNGQTIPVQIDYDKIVWSGMSWALREIKVKDLAPGKPVNIRLHSTEKDPIKLEGAVYQVSY